MPTPSRSLRSTAPVAARSRYVRSTSDLTVNDPDGWVSDGRHGPVFWMGYDTGGGAYPIGPNGPNMVDVIPAVTRLTAIITDPLASVPWKVVEQGFGGDVLPTPRWITDPQLMRPDSRYTTTVLPAVTRSPRTAVYGTWIRSAVWFGTGFLAFIEAENGEPMAGTVRTLNPLLVAPVRDENGALVWEIGDSANRLRSDRDGYVVVGGQRWRIVPLRDPHAPVDEEGRSVSVFERHPDTFATAAAIAGYTTGTFSNDGVPSGFLKVQTPGLTQETADALKLAWMAAHAGSRRSVAILNATTDYTPIARSPLDMALIETQRASWAEMCMAFALDPGGALGINLGNSASYTNAQAWMSRLKVDLLPWIETVEQVVSSLLPAGQGIRLDFSELTRPDPKEHYEALKVAIDAGVLTVDEARNTLGLPALPEPEPIPVPPQLQVVPPPAPDPTPVPEPDPAPTTRSRPPALRR